MRKHWFRSIGLSGLSAIGLVLGLQQAAGNPIEIDIVKPGRNFEFSPANVTITAGQTVKWVVKVSGPPHALDGAPPTPLFKPVPDFTEEATQTFDTVGVIPYHCIYHSSMTGIITVNAVK